ncbi:MAG: T9SS type B sorting domain-containing protein [Cytophagales bacterium]|nr:T9SS type B sorting domain-containing protein [Cytophagales bacterium]
MLYQLKKILFFSIISLSIIVAFAQIPPNDDCANATILDVYPICSSSQGTVANAGAERYNQDVYYQFVAQSRTTSIEVYTDFDASLYLFENCDDVNSIYSTDEFYERNTEVITTTDLIQGNTYYIAIANYEETTNAPNFEICIHSSFPSIKEIAFDPIKDVFGSQESIENDVYLPKFKAIDYDGDGDLDLFTGSSFLLNDNGEFSEKTISLKQSTPLTALNGEFFFLTLGSLYEVLEIEDLNKDGSSDLFLLNDNNRIELYSNVNTENRNWFYETPLNIENENVQKLTFLDFNNDGYKDYVIGTDIGFKIYRNSGDFNDDPTLLYEHFYTGLTKEAGSTDLISADLNNDRLIDLFNGTSFFYRTSTGFVQEDKIKYEEYFLSIKNTTLTDYDNDGIIEVSGEIVHNKDFVSQKSLTIELDVIEFHDNYAIEDIDYDNDGQLNKILSNEDGLFYDKKTESNLVYTSSKTFLQSLVKYTGDINRDGTPEIILYDKPNSTLLYYSFFPNATNKEPQAPTNLSYEVKDRNIVFTWESGSDNETPSELLEYNLVLTSKGFFDQLAEEQGLTETVELAKLLGLYNTSSLYGTILSSDIDTSGNELIENIQVANLGLQKTFTLTPSIEFYSLDAYLFAIDKGGLISSNYAHVSIDEYTHKLFESNKNELTDFLNYPQLQVANFNGDTAWDILMNERLYGSLSDHEGGKVFWNSQAETFSFPSSTSSNGNFVSDLGDFNNDGQLDFLNINSKNNSTSIYTNDKATFTQVYEQNLTQEYQKDDEFVTYQNAVFGDYDSDGDLDCIIPDNDGLPSNDVNDKVRLLKNNEDGIVTEEIELKILYFFDYDQNGEKDVVCVRSEEGITYLELWNRKGSDFTFKQQLMELDANSINNPHFKFESLDMDADGIFELVFHEVDLPQLTIFRRDPFGNYNIQLRRERLVLLDYDNDGLVDYFDFSENTRLYKNYGNWNFAPSPVIFDFLQLLNGDDVFDDVSVISSLESIDKDSTFKINGLSIDYDNDSIADILFSTTNGFNFYKNNSSIKNVAPTIPQDLLANTFEDTVSLTWEKSIDPNNENSGLSYNVQIWDKETGEYITPIHSNEDGRLLLANKYTTNTNQYILRNLADGTYYWKVQAIDPTHLPSAFSVVDSFVVNLVPEITLDRDTICNHTTSKITFDPPSEHYKWTIEGGEIVDSTLNNEITIKWKEVGNHKVVLTNTKFNLSVEDSVLVIDNPSPIINTSFENAQNPLEVTFSTNTTLTKNSINWTIEGENYNSDSAIYTFPIHAVYEVSVNIEYENECKNLITESIDISKPKINGSTSVCGEREVMYTVTPKGRAYEWDVVGGTVIEEYTDSIKVLWSLATESQYVKTLNTEINQFDSVVVKVHQEPVTSFVVPENIGTNSWINFENTSSFADSYTWDFDEVDNTSTEENPSIVFNNIGQHTIVLTASTEEGCESKHQEFVSVSDNIAPILISNFLTPNDDGANDVLKVKNIERYPENTLIVYNAWGQEIYRQEAYDNSWDLRIDGEYIENGQYLCKVKLNEFDQVFEQIITVLK